MNDRDPHGFESASARPRLCVIDAKDIGPAYARLDECRVEVMCSLPSLAQLTRHGALGYDAILVGCTQRLLLSPSARLIALMASPSVDAGAQAAALGFVGFASRDVTPKALERIVAAATRGESAFPRGVLNALLTALARAPQRLSHGGERGLTPRQDQVVELIAQGSTDREIAGILLISESTAHKHVQNALRRLNARTRSQLVAAARRPIFPSGLTTS